MNVIISNKYQSMLQTLDIDVIKNLNGEFEVDDIIKEFQNFFFQRMILDITALKNYRDIKTLQKEVDDLKSEKKELSSRIGGLVRTKNISEKLIKELKETVSKLTIEKEKILKQLKQGHIQLSPKEYEQKITTVELQKAKLNSR